MLLRTPDNVRVDDLRIDLGGHFEIKIEVGFLKALLMFWC